jgi:hypothetical protein
MELDLMKKQTICKQYNGYQLTKLANRKIGFFTVEKYLPGFQSLEGL